MDQALPLRGDAFAPSDPLQGDEDKAAAVEGRDRQDVQNGEVEAQEGGELQDGHPPGAGDLTGDLGDANDAGELGLLGAGEHADDLVAEEDERFAHAHKGLGDSLPGWV